MRDRTATVRESASGPGATALLLVRVVALALAASMILSAVLPNSHAAYAQNIPVKITVSKGGSTAGSPYYTIKVKVTNPKDSGYSIQSVSLSLAGQEISKHKAPKGWMATAAATTAAEKSQKDEVSFSAKAPLRSGAAATFEIGSPSPIYAFKWSVLGKGNKDNNSSSSYFDSGTKSTNISWPSKDIQRNFKWIFEGEEWTWNPTFSKSLYDYYRNRQRPPTEDYSVYVTDPYDDKLISGLVDKIKEVAAERKWDDWQTINFMISFVQSLPYTSDNVTTPFDEYPRYPIETLVDNGGDCEDTSILTAELITKLGYRAILINPPGHMAVGVSCSDCEGTYYQYGDRNYFYLETTGEGWEIGRVPDEYRQAEANMFPLVARPLITFEWRSELKDYDDYYATYRILVTIKNGGSAAAENLRAWTAFDAAEEEGRVWEQITTDPVDLEADGTYQWEITLSPPRGKYTRLHVQVYGDNFNPVESRSDWFRT